MRIRANKTTIPNEVLDEYFRLEKNFEDTKNWHGMSEQQLWEELCLCILSSNVPYELAQSAFFHLLRKGYLELGWIARIPTSETMIALELSRPIFVPVKADGSKRKFRFPNVRAGNIAQSAKLLSSEKGWLSRLLSGSGSEKEVRDLLARHLSGVGLKQASHFLRNIGYSKQLAIVDTHIVSFLEEIEAIQRVRTKTITRNCYLELESRIERICREYSLNLSIFDIAVWRHMRGRRF